MADDEGEAGGGQPLIAAIRSTWVVKRRLLSAALAGKYPSALVGSRQGSSGPRPAGGATRNRL